MKITATGARGFVEFLRAKMPRLYAEIAKKNPAILGLTSMNMEGFGQTDPTVAATVTQGPAPSGWIANISELAKVYLTTRAQKKMWDLQIKQAAQGGPPLDLTQYQPGISVDVGTRTKNLLLWGAVALGAVVLLPRLLKR